MNPGTGLGWKLQEFEYEGILLLVSHVLPMDDLKDHNPNIRIKDHALRSQCWCTPMIDEDGLVIHNSMDGREKHEDDRVDGHTKESMN